MSNNEPAFPVVTADRMWDQGMDLRDYFAAKAMAGLLANGFAFSDSKALGVLTRGSYEIADAMLRARSVASEQHQSASSPLTSKHEAP